MARVVDDGELVALALRESSQVAAAASDFDQADQLLTDAHSRFTELGLDQELVVVDLRRAECQLLRGHGDAAMRDADRALSRARSTNATLLLPMVSRVRGFVQMALGNLPAARESCSGTPWEAPRTAGTRSVWP